MKLRADVRVGRGDRTIAAHVVADPSRRVVIVGPNGAGKSTVLAALAGTVRLDEGRIELGDRLLADTDTDVHLGPHERNVGVVFQDGLLFPHMTVLDNVAFGPRSRGASRDRAGRRAREELERFDLHSLAEARPRALSGGEAQRVALARALAAGPDLLLLDEPFGALDVTSRVEVRRAVRLALDESSATAILVTHDPVEALAMGDRIVVMEKGRVSQSGSPDEIRARPRSAYVGDLVGLNVIHGRGQGDSVEIPGDTALTLAEPMDGPVIVTFHPHAVSLHATRPEGSMRNVWETSVRHVEHFGGRVRVELDSPPGAAVEVTGAAASELGLAGGRRVWASLKATEIGCFPA
ncbi:MAG: ATP-binding cassette domain-containing protein [Actinobacteria bacterium]|nr:ATP-binding cassette domain-containing protein [Actinomycetota bacterium]